MTIKYIKELDELKLVIKNNSKVAIDYYATWCGPCKKISPEFERLSNDNAYAGWTFIKIDVDEAEEIVAEYKIVQMPTFMFFKGGNLVDRYADSALDTLLERLDKY